MTVVASASGTDDRYCAIDERRDICYRAQGDAGRPPILLLAGLGQQLNVWPEQLCSALVARGHYVVRTDNRDIGQSFQHAAPAPRTDQVLARRFHPAQYTLDDMATDVCAFLDELALERVHLVGMSMGGMIAQNVTARRPDRVASLTSIMSTTGASGVGRPAPSTLRRMPRAAARTREEFADRLTRFMRHIGSPGFPFDAERVRTVALEAWDRNVTGRGYHRGFARQLGAILKSGDRTAVVRSIRRPTLVIHGARDRMVAPSGGVATASAISAARLHIVKGMGHDLPAGVLPELVSLITEHVERGSRLFDPEVRA